jgi:hypothetical protein
MGSEQSHIKLAKSRIMSDLRYVDRWQARLIAIIMVSDNFKEAEPKLREVLDDKTMQGR